MKVLMLDGPFDGTEFTFDSPRKIADGKYQDAPPVHFPQQMKFLVHPRISEIETAAEAAGHSVCHRYDLYRVTQDWVEYIHMKKDVQGG